MKHNELRVFKPLLTHTYKTITIKTVKVSIAPKVSSCPLQSLLPSISPGNNRSSRDSPFRNKTVTTLLCSQASPVRAGVREETRVRVQVAQAGAVVGAEGQNSGPMYRI